MVGKCKANLLPWVVHFRIVGDLPKGVSLSKPRPCLVGAAEKSGTWETDYVAYDARSREVNREKVFFHVIDPNE